MQEQHISILPLVASADLPQAGIKAQQILYLAWDEDASRLFVVRWERTRWVCSCHTKRCSHVLATNTFVLTRVRQQTDEARQKDDSS